MSLFDDVKEAPRHTSIGLDNMAAVQVSEAEKVYILHGVRVRFIRYAHFGTSLCKYKAINDRLVCKDEKLARVY